MKLSKDKCALVAQLDRVTGYEPVGQGFESLPARQARMFSSGLFLLRNFLWDSNPKGSERRERRRGRVSPRGAAQAGTMRSGVAKPGKLRSSLPSPFQRAKHPNAIAFGCFFIFSYLNGDSNPKGSEHRERRRGRVSPRGAAQAGTMRSGVAKPGKLRSSLPSPFQRAKPGCFHPGFFLLFSISEYGSRSYTKHPFIKSMLLRMAGAFYFIRRLVAVAKVQVMSRGNPGEGGESPLISRE